MVKCPGWTKDTCMCGGDIDHSPWEGHSPVSMWDYHECTEEEDDNSRPSTDTIP